MSKTNEVVEKPPEEPEPAGEVNGKNSEETVELSKKDSNISMLEDEEMPTYSSISSSTKPDSTVTIFEQRTDDVPLKRDRSPSPEPSEGRDNEDNESIYVVSSTADSDRHAEDFDDEEEEDYDSEDMNEEDEDGEDDEGDDGRNDYDREHYERESDEFEADRFERASDDFVLRHNDSVKKSFKERSQSLQDLASVEARYGRRRSSRFQWERNSSGLKENPYSCQSWNSKPYQGPERYKHIESKVKRYIQDIKDQNRLSRNEDHAKNKDRDYEIVEDSNENRRKTSTGDKHIKGYAEKVMKGLERDEFNEDQNSSYATLERMENGEEPMTLRLSSDRMSGDSNIPMEVDHSPIDRQSHEDKIGKVNGIIEFSEGSEVTCTPILKGTTLNRMNEQVNGTDPMRNLVNLRTLSYEEYMRGAAQEEDEVETASSEICSISPEKPSYDVFPSKSHNRISSNSKQITNVKSTRNVPKDNDDYTNVRNSEHKAPNSVKMTSQATETIQGDNPEVVVLKASLNQRNAQFDCLQVAYQKTLEENFALKQEIENLKKVLKEKEENQSREKKSAAIQTEKLAVTDQQKNNVTVENVNKKTSASSITSAISSIHQWSESGYSPPISIASPDVRNALNSDDSNVFENTPKKPPRTFSRAFITSSRILQTLSNITQGKCNVSSPISQDQRNQETLENQANITDQPSTSDTPSKSKKRKATEMLGVPFEQPFKIPHTSGCGKKKPNQDSGNETSQMNGLPSENENCRENSKEGETQEKNIKNGELGDNLKYYIYQDDENSKERSFLIQAEEPGKLSNKGTVRECGPYLLGNLEVRMTEVNGTINIWGKEINLESSEEELGVSGKSTDMKSDHGWKKTPQMNLLNNSYIVSSTNRKPKHQPRFSDSNFSKFSHSSEHTIPKSSLQENERSCNRRSSLTTDNNCECSSRSHRLSWSGCQHLMDKQKHGCCSRNVEMNYEKCGCTHNVRRHEYHPCNRVYGCAGDLRRHSYSGRSNDISACMCSNHSCHCSKSENEGNYRHQTAHCQSYDEEKNCQHFTKQCHLTREFPHSCSPKHVATNNECRERCASNSSQNRNTSTQEEDDPLTPTQQNNEPPEVRKRRLSGKRVRGLLMDLLKGCGDCRTPNPANMSKSNLGDREATYLPSYTPEIVVTPCSPRASCSKKSQSMEKCCDNCSRRIEMATEIEAQFEFFRIEMERLRSRSDALLDKFNMLKSSDVY